MEILDIIKEHYPINFDNLEMMRDAGSTSYTAYSGGDKYFLLVIKPAFFDTAVKGADIQTFLQNKNFPVTPNIYTNNGLPYAKTEEGIYILYDFIEGSESDPERGAEAIGKLIGKLHHAMKTYPCELVKRDKHFFVGRYIDILRKKQYSKTEPSAKRKSKHFFIL